MKNRVWESNGTICVVIKRETLVIPRNHLCSYSDTIAAEVPCLHACQAFVVSVGKIRIPSARAGSTYIVMKVINIIGIPKPATPLITPETVEAIQIKAIKSSEKGLNIFVIFRY
tara:strand:+ start:941 stop:1282 length:342 start_codon:yes stop_codon:yes gene_type:complete